MQAVAFIALVALSLTARSADLSVPITIPTAEDGDQIVLFSNATKKPLPVSDDKVEILGANITFEPKPNDTTKIHWGWTFSAQFKGNSRPVSILVEDETRAPITLAFESDAPRLQAGGGWAGIAPVRPLSKQFIAVLDSGQPIFRVFRFTIKYQDGSSSKLHQASVHDPTTLKSMIVALGETLQ